MFGSAICVELMDSEWHCRAALGRPPDGLLSDGKERKRLLTRVQLVGGLEGKYMIGCVAYSQPDRSATSSSEGSGGITWGGNASQAGFAGVCCGVVQFPGRKQGSFAHDVHASTESI